MISINGARKSFITDKVNHFHKKIHILQQSLDGDLIGRDRPSNFTDVWVRDKTNKEKEVKNFLHFMPIKAFQRNNFRDCSK